MATTSATRPPAWTRHAPEELVYVGTDEAGLVSFAAPSQHDASRVNTVVYDPETREATCDCICAEVGRYACWHAHWVEAAYLRRVCRDYARQASDAQLARAIARVERRLAGGWAFIAPIDPIARDVLLAEQRRRTLLAAERVMLVIAEEAAGAAA